MATTETTPSIPNAHDFFAYDRGRHYRSRVECPRRPITEVLARDAVHCGSIEPNPVKRAYQEWRYRHRVDGCDVVVAAGESKDPGVDYRIFTAFVDVVDPVEAWVSETWSHDNVEVALTLQTLNAGHRGVVDGFDLRSTDISNSIPYHGHVVVCQSGFQTPYCPRCDFESIDGGDFDNRPCHV